ncbi:MAG: hypothetical protein PF450_01730 [Bacteroidales bacterium]|jgi:hypothetical protein|nr:hypothetical protein [Bacteroidales bacterium]
MEQRAAMIISISTSLGVGLGEVLADSEKGFKDLMRSSLLATLDFLTKFARMKMVQATIDSIAKYGPVVGGIRSGLSIVAIEGALGYARGAINKIGSIEMFDGGHTGPGTKHQPTGIVHANEYVIPQEGYFNPSLRPFIDMIENARQAGSLRTLSMAGTSLPGHADGGPTSPQESQAPLTDPKTIELMQANLAWMQKLYKDGVHSVIGDRQVRDLRDRAQTITDIETSISK